MRIIGVHWELITYISLNNYDDRYHQLDNEIKNMTNHCTEKFVKYEICSRFDNILRMTFLEIASQTEQMYESIGRFFHDNTNQEHVALLGVCDDNCTKETTEMVEKIEKK